MRRGRVVRWALRGLAGMAVLVALSGGAWLTGVPQERAIVWAVQRSLGAVAVVEWEGTAPDLRVSRLELYPDADAYRAGSPLLVADDIAVSYRLFPKDGRRVREVRIGNVDVSLDLRDPERPNYGFLLAEDADSPSQTQDNAYVPTSIAVDRITVAAETADGRLTFDSLGLTAELTDASTITARYQGADSTAAWYPSAGEAFSVDRMTIRGQVSLAQDHMNWSHEMDAPDLAHTAMLAAVDLSGDEPVVHASLEDLSLRGDRLGPCLAALRAPILFDEFSATEGEAVVTLSETPSFYAKLSATARGTALAGAAEPLYADTARVEIDAVREDELRAKATLTLAEDQGVAVDIVGNETSGNAKFDAGNWTRSQLLAALPPAFRESIEGLGFDSFTAAGDLAWTEDGFIAKTRASSQGGGGDAQPIYWELDAHGPRDRLAGVEGKLEARLGDRRITANASYIGEDEYHAQAHIEEVQLAPWVQLLAGDAAAEGVHGTIEGDINASAKGKDAPLTIAPEFHLRQFAYADVMLDEITMAGTMEFDSKAQRLSIADLHADSVDGMTSLQITDFVYQLDEETGEGDFTGGANLSVVAAAVGNRNLYGSGTIDNGRIRIEKSDISVMGDFSSGFVGWEDRTVEPKVDVLFTLAGNATASASVDYNLERAEGRFVNFAAKLGDGTEFRLLDTAFQLDPFNVTGVFECDSDLQVAVGMGWLQEVEGTLIERSQFALNDDALSLDWDLKIDGPKLVLPANAGSAEGLSFEGSGTYEDGLAGSGTVRAAKLTAAGGSILDASGPATFDGDTMKITPARGRLFGGDITADVDVGVLVESMPIVLTGSFDAVDLAILTDEVKPPNTSLTGTAIGTLNARYSAKGLESFTLDASAPGGLSLNKSLVSDLLQSDRFLAGAGERVAERAMDKLLGTAPQRPFDTGRMHVFLDSGKIQGTAELRSVKTEAYNGLNLTVNLDMDQSALAEALKVLEESSLGNVDF